MERLEEIRQRTEAGGPIRRIDMKYLLSEVDRLNSALTAEKSKYKELQRYNVDCTKEAASLLCENSDLRKTLAAMTARAEAAEAERDACKADLKSMADWYRDSVCDDGICGWCKQDADHGLDGYANECAGFYKNDCFEWRGPQEAGEGGQDD